MRTSRWFLPPLGRRRWRCRLFCFPHLGGSASAFRGFGERVPEEIGVSPVELPGRGFRFNEPPLRTLEALVDALSQELAPVREPYAFFGHSFGAVLSFQIARRMAQLGVGGPLRLFASAHEPAHLSRESVPLDRLDDPGLIHRLEQLGGTPPEVFANPQLLELVLPIVRADAQAYESRPRVAARIAAPISAYVGAEDPSLRPEEAGGWRECTLGDFSLKVMPGGHFYFQTDPEPFFEAFNAELLRLEA